MSNFHKTRFIYDGREWNSSEEAIMFLKATTFDDVEIAKQILENKNPFEARRLGRKVKNFNETLWRQVRENYVPHILKAKFNQVPHLREWLLSSDDAIQVETGYDKTWSIRLPVGGVNHPNNWAEYGENFLYRTLMNIRNDLRENI
jgi:ribA/ribD-fused uncharacterized protein